MLTFTQLTIEFKMFHLDIRPSNVIILPNGKLTLIDFANSIKNKYEVESPEWTEMIETERKKANQEFDFRLAEVQAFRLIEMGVKAFTVHSGLSPSPDAPQRYIDLLITRSDLKRAEQFSELAKEHGLNVEFSHTGKSSDAPVSFAVDVSSSKSRS